MQHGEEQEEVPKDVCVCVSKEHNLVGRVKTTEQLVFTTGMEWTIFWKVRILELSVLKLKRSILFQKVGRRQLTIVWSIVLIEAGLLSISFLINV